MPYVANHSVKYNGKIYGTGEVVPVTDKEAADLVKARVLKSVGEAVAVAESVESVEPSVASKDIGRMNKTELLAYAGELGVELAAEDNTKAEILAKIGAFLAS